MRGLFTTKYDRVEKRTQQAVRQGPRGSAHFRRRRTLRRRSRAPQSLRSLLRLAETAARRRQSAVRSMPGVHTPVKGSKAWMTEKETSVGKQGRRGWGNCE